MSKEGSVRGFYTQARFRVVLTYVVMGLLLAAAIIVAGDELVLHIVAIESWIGRLGPWGIVAFAALFVSSTSLLVPETVLSIMAGALFGLVGGLVAVVAGTLIAATLQYVLARMAHKAVLEAVSEVELHDRY